MIVPDKLKQGDHARIIAPSMSMGSSWVEPGKQSQGIERLKAFGLEVSFGKYVHEIDDFESSSIEHRISDLHDAFADTDVALVIASSGGFNSNQLLRCINYDLVRMNPKIFCGFSDITALGNALYAKAGLITYSSPSVSKFGSPKCFEYMVDHFKQCLFSDSPIEINQSVEWADRENDEYTMQQNDGYWTVHAGTAEGTLIGGNLCTLNLLQGTEYMPSLDGAVLFVEDDYNSSPRTFDRDLQSLIHQPGFDGVRGIVIGRFQIASKMTKHLLTRIIETKRELARIPVIANADFGHTTPMFTFPIGGSVAINATDDACSIVITEH